DGCVIMARELRPPVARERIISDSGVAVAVDVSKKRVRTYAGVLVAVAVVCKRYRADSRVVVTRADEIGVRVVGGKRGDANGRVVLAGDVVSERFRANGRIAGGSIIVERRRSQGGVSNTRRVLKQGSPAGSRVQEASCVVVKRLKTVGRILVPRINLKRLSPSGGVLLASGEALKRFRTERRVVGTGGQAHKRSSATFSDVRAGVQTIRCRANGQRYRRKR